VTALDAHGRKTGFGEEPDPHGGTVSGNYLDSERSGLWRHRFGDGECDPSATTMAAS